MIETGRFKLEDAFISEYNSIRPPFGFNGLGEFTYMRTYSRVKENGLNESWFETIQRVVEGTYEIQRKHILSQGLEWGAIKAQRSAQEMYDRMFNMKFLPPGRGLWLMGTDALEKKNLYAGLNNCAFTSTEHIDTNNTEPFEFLMDMSMLGVGVGFDVKGAGKIKIQAPLANGIYVIPDTREGWVESLKLLLLAYFDGQSEYEFDYSKIRKKGSVIKGFGGVASGFEPLRDLHDSVREVFYGRAGTELSVTDIVDIMNMIGICVVAGNIRRSAEIVFGDASDPEYMKLKDYYWDGEKYTGSRAKRAKWGWASNNSVFAEIGMDYSEIAKQIAVNGEPGIMWLSNAKKFSRMNEKVDYKDIKACGANPCAEQTLEHMEMCCLVETFPTMNDDLEDYERSLKFAYLYAKTVTLTQTHWSQTNRVMLRNRRIGTSMSGFAQFLDTNGIDVTRAWMNSGYDAVQEYDKIYSEFFCVPRSIKTTSIKPSGTVSLLPGVTPGVHFPESNFYIRRVNVARNSPLIESCKSAGYNVENSVSDPSSSVVEFPVSLNNVRTLNDVGMWEQLSVAAFVQEHWADNQVSCTVTFKKSEASSIKHALVIFQYKLKGLSFLPRLGKGVYAQMPYEEISEDKYMEMTSHIRKIDFSQIGIDSKPEQFCDGKSCEI